MAKGSFAQNNRFGGGPRFGGDFFSQSGGGRRPFGGQFRPPDMANAIGGAQRQQDSFTNSLRPQISAAQQFQNQLEGGGTPQGQQFNPVAQQAQAFQQQLGGINPQQQALAQAMQQAQALQQPGNMQQQLQLAQQQAQQQFPGITPAQGGLMQQQLQAQKAAQMQAAPLQQAFRQQQQPLRDNRFERILNSDRTQR